jgi:hypothetical protein
MSYPLQAYSGPPGEIPPGYPPAVPIYAAHGGNPLIFSGECLVVGWSCRNTDAAAGHVIVLYDGTDTNGRPFGYSKPASSGGAETQSPSPPGLLCRSGVYFQDSSGFVDIAVWIVPL